MFALFSGAAADRLDRRRLTVTVNTARALVLLLIFATVTGGFLTLPLLYLTLFLLGTSETLADTAGSALIVGAVETDHLGRANARLSATLTVGNHLLGPPLGVFLFVATPEQRRMPAGHRAGPAPHAASPGQHLLIQRRRMA